jgi:hypothetical protein
MTHQDLNQLQRFFSGRMTRRAAFMRLGASGLAAGLLGTSHRVTPPAQAIAAGVQDVVSSIAANPNNAISAVVTAEVGSAELVRVEFGIDDRFDESTPDFIVSGSTMELPVLGLRPETDYTLRVVTIAPDGATGMGNTLSFRTGSLPAAIPSFEILKNSSAEPGFIILSVTDQGFAPPVLILDRDARVVWYREVPNMVIDFQLQPNGHYTAALSQPGPQGLYGVGIFEEWDRLGNVVHTWTAEGHEYTDYHDIVLLDGGQEALVLAYVAETRDLSDLGGPEDGTIWGHILQRVTRAGEVTFEWNSFDHFKVEEADDHVWRKDPNDPPLPPGSYDWTHPNSIAVDSDGNYLVSSRHFSEVTKIDSRTGDVIWRMGGGKGNQFEFIDDPHNGFSAQHGGRRLENGNLLLHDNGNDHEPPSTRTVEYAIDEEQKVARLVWSYEPGIFADSMGFAQRLPGGNTLITPGHDHRIFEVSPTGEVVWEIRLPVRGWGATAWRDSAPGLGGGSYGLYRSMWIPSLYEAT